MTHNELDAYVANLAEVHQLYAYHTRNSVGSQKGWPDWVLLGSKGALFRENKIPPDKCTTEQRKVGYTMQALGFDWAVWTPLDVQNGLINREMRNIK